MKDLEELKAALLNKRPVPWDQFPDIGLYMDQVISYMPRQLINISGGQLTPAMVNNYIKYGLLPRSEGKKYSKAHLAILTAICTLKQVLSVKDLDILFEHKNESVDINSFYLEYQKVLDEALLEASSALNTDMDLSEMSQTAFKLAVSSYCSKLVCEGLIEIIRKNTQTEKTKKKPGLVSENEPKNAKI